MKAKNLLYSVGITLAAGCLLLLLFYPGGSPLGNLFDLFILLIILHYVGIGYAILALLLRMLKFFRIDSILYLLAGSFNVFFAMVGIALFAANLANKEWLHNCIGNLSIGFLIFADAFFPRQKSIDSQLDS